MTKGSKWLLLLTFAAVGSILLWAFCEGTKPGPPNTESLKAALQSTTRVVIRSGGTCHQESGSEKMLFETTNSTEISELISLMLIDETGSDFHCGCCGEPTLEFYKGRTLKASVGVHH